MQCLTSVSLMRQYSRYADDIYVSRELDPSYIIRNLIKIVDNHKLKINKEKTLVIPKSKRQIVTGVVVNNKLQAPKPYRRAIRLEMHYCMKYGLDDHIKKVHLLQTELINYYIVKSYQERLTTVYN